PEFIRIAGSALPPAVADQIVPGSTSEAEVRALCGRPDEEGQRRGHDQRRTLVYRGTRRLARPRRALGPLATVAAWEQEEHELEIELENGRVSAVQSRVRRGRPRGKARPRRPSPWPSEPPAAPARRVGERRA